MRSTRLWRTSQFREKMGSMLSFVLSTIAFFVVSFFTRRHLDDMGVPRSASRAIVVFVIALGAAYACAALVDWIA